MTDERLLSRLDLNLLVSLDALLTERSVTRAAERLRLSQPALSASLARLRSHFDDPLLARQGNSYELTPLAARLTELTTIALEASRRVFESQTTWSASGSTREFTVFGSDYGFATIAKTASDIAARTAPGVRFRFVLHNPVIVEDAALRLRAADGLIIPHGFITDLPYVDLWQDRWLAVVADDNDAVGEALTMENLATLPWVSTYQSRSAFTSAGRQMQQLGIEPHVDVVVESFLALPHFVAGTRRIGMLQTALAPMVAAMPGVRTMELPFDATPILNALWWHPVHSRDPEHSWMRDVFRQAVSELSV
ncbi:LysR family transcriptional regulator [Herbiconiux sp. 11R-BC]|uniref:LysR family transcriptional regulator n=1 Tax=Herbiconiux sp. 11R-BC TaxID=3111637 RepID=UPI003C05F3C1